LPSTIEQVHREYAGRGLAVLAINIAEPPAKVAEWVRQKKVTMPVLLDPPGLASRAYRITSTPTVFVVSREGRLVAKAMGTTAWMSPRGRAFLDLLVAP
jgi:hypothetical protein